MPLDDLDLEFEDEEEIKRKKHEAVQVDVDLEFHVPETVAKPKVNRPGPPASSEEVSQPPVSPPKSPAPPVPEQRPVRPVAEVKKIEEIRAAAQVKKTPVTAQETVPPQVQGSSALKVEATPVVQPQYDLESEEIVALREKVRQTELEAQVRVQVAEYKMEIYGELMGDIKIMEHQINQLLVRINAKHPDMKQEILTIKKVLADFTAKKRK